MEYKYGPDLLGVTEEGILIVTCPDVDGAITYYGNWMGITPDDQTDLTLVISEYTFTTATIANGLAETEILN